MFSQLQEAFQLSRQSVALLLAANALPLFGIAFFGWDKGSILMAYWSETFVIGFLNIFKLIKAEGSRGDEEISSRYNWKAVLVFLAHYGLWVFIFLGYFLAIVAGEPIPSDPFARLAKGDALSNVLKVWPFIIAILVSHGVSFFRNYLGLGEYRQATVQSLMIAPYLRMVAMLAATYVGTEITALGGSNAVIVVLKTSGDFYGHLSERLRFRLPAGKAGGSKSILVFSSKR